MRLAGLDFETANGRTGSICAAGCAILEDGAVTESREWLVCPHVGYRWMRPEYTRIHGLTYGDVRDCPEFCDIWPELRRMLQAAELLDCMERLKRHRIHTAFEKQCSGFGISPRDTLCGFDDCRSESGYFRGFPQLHRRRSECRSGAFGGSSGNCSSASDPGSRNHRNER